MLAVLTCLDWLVIGGYLVGVLPVGLYFTRRAGKNTGEFFVSGQEPAMVARRHEHGGHGIFLRYAADRHRLGPQEWCSRQLDVVVLRRWRDVQCSCCRGSGGGRKSSTMVELTEMRYSGRSAAACFEACGRRISRCGQLHPDGVVDPCDEQGDDEPLGIDPLLAV